MNVYDSARMADVLAPLGYAPAPVPDGADMVILNTCHIRDKAAEKVFSELGRLRRLKEQRAADGGRMILAVAGCVAQAEGAEILARAPYVDIVLGPQTYHRLPEMVARAARGRRARSSRPISRPSTNSTSCRMRRRRRGSPRSSPSRRAATGSAASASCPTRAAPRQAGRRRR